MKRVLIYIVLFLPVAVFAQSSTATDDQQAVAMASVVKWQQESITIPATNVLLHPVPGPLIHQHDSRFGWGVSLVVLGGVKMAVGLGVLGWAIAGVSKHTLTGGGIPLGFGLGTFHLLTGAGLVAGGAVLIKKSKGAASGNLYLTVPSMTVQSDKIDGTVMGFKTALIF